MIIQIFLFIYFLYLFFVSRQSDILEIRTIECLALNKYIRFFFLNSLYKISKRISSKYKNVAGMNTGAQLQGFVVVGWLSPRYIYIYIYWLQDHNIIITRCPLVSLPGYQQTELTIRYSQFSPNFPANLFGRLQYWWHSGSSVVRGLSAITIIHHGAIHFTNSINVPHISTKVEHVKLALISLIVRG